MFKKIILRILIFTIIYFNNGYLVMSNEKTFYDLSINTVDGNILNTNEYKNKVVLLVNVASYCGFTKQYEGLQNLWQEYKDKGLVVLGTPSGSFNQEKNSEKEVLEFCEVNFGINFPMTEIIEVKGDKAHPIYKWAKNNYGSSAVPKWNFHKILIDKNGNVADTFVSFTKPNSKKIISKIESLLN